MIMIVLKKNSLLFFLTLLVFGACMSEPKLPPPPPASTLPLEVLSGSWEVSDAERNGKNTTALEGIYFTFTTDEKLITNFNLSVEERTFPFRMWGDTIVALSNPKQPYLIESLAENGMVLRTKMEGYQFKLTLKAKKNEPTEVEEEI